MKTLSLYNVWNTIPNIFPGLIYSIDKNNLNVYIETEKIYTI